MSIMSAIAQDKFSISVIVPTYNRSQYMDYTLKSLVGQNLDKVDFEVVIVDDGSSDDTFQRIKTFENIINLKYVYQIDKGFRVASARNLGIRVAEGSICMFIDSGIIVKSDCLQQHIKSHAGRENSVAIIGYIYGYSAESEEDFGGRIDPYDPDRTIANIANVERVWDMRENIYRKYHDKIEDTIVPWTLFWSGNVSVGRQALFEVGLFDENFDGNWGTEDNDLGYRLYQAKKEIFLCRDAVVVHLPHKMNVDSRLRGGAENCRYFHEKFQTLETQIYFDHYVKDLSGQCASNEAIDFHELITHQLRQGSVLY